MRVTAGWRHAGCSTRGQSRFPDGRPPGVGDLAATYRQPDERTNPAPQPSDHKPWEPFDRE